MKTESWVIHALFKCDDCGAEWENYITAQAQASRHARTAEHTVRGEIGKACVYDGKTREAR